MLHSVPPLLGVVKKTRRPALWYPERAKRRAPTRWSPREWGSQHGRHACHRVYLRRVQPVPDRLNQCRCYTDDGVSRRPRDDIHDLVLGRRGPLQRQSNAVLEQLHRKRVRLTVLNTPTVESTRYLRVAHVYERLSRRSTSGLSRRKLSKERVEATSPSS